MLHPNITILISLGPSISQYGQVPTVTFTFHLLITPFLQGRHLRSQLLEACLRLEAAGAKDRKIGVNTYCITFDYWEW